ncbi:hypothetical protein [Dehalococcoides mccartyi]|uniref:hypothetical protein n=1 Tax=Dehalococcoides mccartyi TaxID=61435 RepID=UPI000804D758|nr:hypothetical protein [Dehalococcoides mccartyi]OBW61988.1 MAG: hypothetical protein A9181_03195 [Dehalococcoides mccartyi]
MELKDFVSMVEKINNNRTAILDNKNHDYSCKADALANFKRIARAIEILGIDTKSPTGVALFMLVMKVDRFNNLTKNDAKPECESVLDTVIDGHNYLDFAYALSEEGGLSGVKCEHLPMPLTPGDWRKFENEVFKPLRRVSYNPMGVCYSGQYS